MKSMNFLNGRLAAAVLAAALLLAPSLASAGEYSRSGIYAGVNGVYGVNLFQNQIDELVSNATIDPSGGLNARLGWRIFPWLAAEGQYEWIDGFKIKVPSVGSAVLSSHTVTANLRLFVPIWRIHPYALAGFGYNTYKLEGSLLGGPTSSLDQGSFAGRLGAGADFYITKHIALNAEVTGLLTASDLDFQATSLSAVYYLSVSAGLVYRF